MLFFIDLLSIWMKILTEDCYDLEITLCEAVQCLEDTGGHMGCQCAAMLLLLPRHLVELSQVIQMKN